MLRKMLPQSSMWPWCSRSISSSVISNASSVRYCSDPGGRSTQLTGAVTCQRRSWRPGHATYWGSDASVAILGPGHNTYFGCDASVATLAAGAHNLLGLRHVSSDPSGRNRNDATARATLEGRAGNAVDGDCISLGHQGSFKFVWFQMRYC